ncbi:MAG TPA: cysteine-rich CWC family protein [Burkholderiales bacterium]|nr:cysteine-rich CWC family protein [Burkholderiales bacterium]
MQSTTPNPERCARCGAPFHCGRDEAECWCASLPALEPVPGRACLCRHCLERELKRPELRART